MITDFEAMQVGKAIAELCGLKEGKDGRYKTSFGDKTVIGLGRCVERVMVESVKDVRALFNGTEENS